MNRLIDADKLRRIFEDSEYPCKLQETLLGIVDAQPTAFDVDEVMKQLKDLKAMYWFSIANTGDEKLDIDYENVGNALDKAIEIVKGGGVE